MPHLHINNFTRQQAADWVHYLRRVVDAEEHVREILERARRETEKKNASSPYLHTPALHPHT